MDIRFKFGSNLCIVGSSGSGKTTFVERLLSNPKVYFDRIPEKNIWHYGQVKPKIKNVIMKQGLPDNEEIPKNSIIVIDDLFIEARNDGNVTNLFTRVAHHNNNFIIFLSQNLFHSSSQNRTRNLNTHYLVVFKNPRDKLQIKTLARQMCANYLVDAFIDATSGGPHKYLLFDFRQETHDNVRIRTNIFLGEEQYAYIDKHCNKNLLGIMNDE